MFQMSGIASAAPPAGFCFGEIPSAAGNEKVLCLQAKDWRKAGCLKPAQWSPKMNPKSKTLKRHSGNF